MTLYMIGKLTPNSPYFNRGLVKYVPGRGYFRAVLSQNGDKFATSPTPPIVERLPGAGPFLNERTARNAGIRTQHLHYEGHEAKAILVQNAEHDEQRMTTDHNETIDAHHQHRTGRTQAPL